MSLLENVLTKINQFLIGILDKAGFCNAAHLFNCKVGIILGHASQINLWFK